MHSLNYVMYAMNLQMPESIEIQRKRKKKTTKANPTVYLVLFIQFRKPIQRQCIEHVRSNEFN